MLLLRKNQMVDDFSHDFLSSMSLSKGKNRNVHDIALNNLSTSEIIEDRSFIRAARVFTPDPYGRQLLFHFISFHEDSINGGFLIFFT